MKGMTVNLFEIMLTVGGRRHSTKKTEGKWPCAVCGKGVGSNLVQCTNCQRLVHKRSSGIKGSLYKISKSFVCSVCLCPSVDTGDGSSVEIVDEFCYIGYMDGDSAADVTARIRSRWLKFRSLVSFLTAKDVFLLLQGKVYDACLWSRMLHGNETWSLKRENEVALYWAEMRMIGWMCGVKLRDKLSCVELRQWLGKEATVKVVQRN